MRLRGFSALLLTFAAALPVSAQRLPTTVTPVHYDLAFTIDLEHERFTGDERIQVQLAQPASKIVLNAVEMEIADATVSAGGGPALQAKAAFDAPNETVTLTPASAVPKGPAEIHLKYSAKLNEKLRGLYLSKGETRKYAVTQFESTDARRAFPSFDEPSFKATFAISATIDRGDTAISNGRIVSDTPGPGPAQHTLKFSTTAKMSSYLVALAVGDFQCLEGGADDIPIRICATPDKKPLGEIALRSAEDILKFYDRYYAIKYPFGKLDVVAVPDFAAGAMENTGAIFYRETDLLADTKTASVRTHKVIASVLAHEMAHQWFGDLVTMAWWDDLWLNEGFATWMANHPLAALHPEWNVPVDEGDENQIAMTLDALHATRPIHARVDSPAQIEEAFDAIAYQKGAAVLRMIEGYVGADTFRAGVNAYLEAHAYGNATSQDFWSAIAKASGKPVDKVLPTFVNQPGVPVVDVALSCAGGRTTLTMSQQRFFVDPSLNRAARDERWQIPVCVKTPGAGSPQCDVIANPTQTIALPGTDCAPWAFANAGAEGYYRTAYAPSALHALAPHVETGLTAPERLSLASDEWALVRAGRHDVTAFLDLARGYAGEPAAGVLTGVADRIAYVHDYLAAPAVRPQFEAWIRQTFRPALDKIGMETKPSDDENTRELRAGLVALLGAAGEDPDVIRQARAMVDASLTGGAPLDPTVASALIDVAAEHGDAKLYDELGTAASKATSPDEHYRYLFALPTFPEPALVDRGLQRVMSPDMRSQDAAIYLAQFLVHADSRARAWSFIKSHWTELEPKITISGGDTNLVNALSAACDPGMRDDIKSFFATHKLPTASRTLDQAMERISNCIELKQTQEPKLTEWLKGNR